LTAFSNQVKIFLIGINEGFMRRTSVYVVLLMGMSILGCGGSDEIQLPTDKLTPEQEAQIKKDDDRVADEESQGKKKR